MAKFREMPQHVHRLFIEIPGNAIAAVAVQAAMRGKQAERDPAFVHVRILPVESADVVTPEGAARQPERQAAAQFGGH